MPSGRRIGAEIRNAIMRLALAGRSKTEVSQRLGLAMNTIHAHWPTPPKKKTDNAPIGNKAP